MRAEELVTRLDGGPLLLDGGMGTMLMAAGLPPGRAPEAWVLEHPVAVAAVHREYAEAGADILLTCTFGGSPPKLAAAGLAGQCAAVNAAAAALTREGAGGALVGGDIGPTGLQLPPVGRSSLAELEDAFRPQVEALVGAGVDLLVVETMYDLREAEAAVRAAAANGLPVLAAMTFEARRRGFFTVMGNPLAESLTALVAAGATAVGCNCSVTAEVMAGMVRAARDAVPTPLLAEPNAGQPRLGDGGVTYDEQPASFAAGLMALLAAGAGIVGGCCGTTPAHIRAARALMDSARP